MSTPVDQPASNFQRLFDIRTWNYQYTEVIALAVTTTNIKHPNEVYLALAAQAFWTLKMNYNGPDGAYNVLAGFHAGRGRYSWKVYLPTILMFWETVQDVKKATGASKALVLADVLTYKVTTRWGFFALGYLLGKSRLM